MDRKLGGVVLVCLGLCGVVHAQDDDFTGEDAAEVFLKCAALYEVSAEMMRAGGKPSSAEFLHGMANGARTSAAVMIAGDEVDANPSAKPKAIAAYMPRINATVESQMLQFRALYETQDMEQIEGDMKLCAEASSVQKDIVTELRKSYVAPTDDAP